MSSKAHGQKRRADSASSAPASKSAKFSDGWKNKNTGGGAGGKPSGNKWNNKGGSNWSKGGNGNSFNKGKGKAAAKPKEKDDEPAQKRKKPVTQGGGDESDVSMGDDEFPDDEEFDEMDVEPTAEAAAGGEEKRGKMSKAERAALHAAQPHRTTLLPSHALLVEILPKWELARQSEMPKEERKVEIDELYNTVKGRIAEISRGHKGGRILQTIVKYGGKEERLGVAMELQPQWRAMMESKYSKFLMSKLIRYCPSMRPLLIPVISKHLTSLLFHADAVQPISDFYDLWASAKERRLLVRGFYPREISIFDGGKTGNDVPGLEGSLEATNEAGRERVLDAVEKTVVEVFNATQKTALAQSLFHRFVHEYLTCIYKFLPADAAAKKYHELLDAALESLPEIVHTKDGSAVVRAMLVRGNAKDRKGILQHLRKHSEAIAKDADAQLVLFTAFDVVDDTKMMGKAFVADLVALAPQLVFDKAGKRALHYLLTPAASRHFLPSTLASLGASADEARALGTSKKDARVRRQEILGYASPGLLQLVAEKGEELVRDPGAGLLVQDIMLYSTGDKGGAVAALAAPLAAPLTGDGSHPLELAHATRTYKTLFAGGHFNMGTKAIDVVDPELGAAFAQAAWDALSSDDAGGAGNVAKAAAAAPFVLLELVEALAKTDTWAGAKAVLKADAVKDAVAASEMKGANVLAERLAGI